MLFLLIIGAFLIGFPAIWCFVLFILSNVGSWRRLAQSYRTSEPISGTVLRWQSAKIGWVNFNRALTICILDEGLRLSLPFIFRLGHPPLLIPWSDFRDVRSKKVLLITFLEASVGEPVITKLLLPTTITEHLPE